jgi:multidrug resistance efflux pump
MDLVEHKKEDIMTTAPSFEQNSLRKSHRTTISLGAVIENRSYQVIDWSMTGLSVKLENDADFKVGNNYKSLLILNMKEANISFNVNLKLIHKSGDKLGFEYEDISLKNKKVLRRYIELYFDGKLDETDTLVSTYEEPDIISAIHNPIKLNEYEKSKLESSFLRKSIQAILYTLLLLGVLGALFYQKVLYKFDGIGVVEKNYELVYPKHSGVVEKIYVKERDKISTTSILADLNSDEVYYKVNLLENIKQSQQKEIKLLGKNDDLKTAVSLKKQLLDEYYKEYKNAKVQLSNHIITKPYFQNIKSKYLTTKERYTLLKKELNDGNINSSIKVENIKDTELKIQNRKNSLEDYRVFSSVDGEIYEVLSKIGDKVDNKTALFTIWLDKTPLILAKIPLKSATDIRVGDKVTIIANSDEELDGIIERIESQSEDKSDLENIIAYIKLDDSTKRLAPKSVVKVLFNRGF